jgi:hypothetical protein
MRRTGRRLITENVSSAKPMSAELTLKISNARRIAPGVARRRQNFEPDRILPEPA